MQDTLQHSEKAATAQDKVNESRVQMEEAMRVRVHLESELKAIKEQLVMERHVASNKVQEFAPKLQIALTARDENAHTCQLALSESNEQNKSIGNRSLSLAKHTFGNQ